MAGERIKGERFLVGIRGLGLLRGYPFDDPEKADAELSTIAELATRDADLVEVDLMDTMPAYADWSDAYDGPNPLIEAEEAVLRPILEGLPAGRAIDAACGTGRVALLLAKLGHEVLAVDPSREMLAHARGKEAASVTFVEGDLASLPAADGSVDLATCALALTHVPDLAPAIAELARVVRPGGHVVLTDIHPISAATGGHAWFRRTDGSRGVTRNHVHWPSDYVGASNAAGLVVERCEEPRFEARYAEHVSSPEVREALCDVLVGLPYALIWQLRRV